MRLPLATPLLSSVLDHLRWLSASVVLVGHAREVLFLPRFPVGDLPGWAKLFYAATNFQKEAVIVFFVLSGLLVGTKLLEYGRRPVFPLAGYATDRLSRLLVVLVPALMLSGLAALMGACEVGGAGAWLSSLVFLQDLVTPAPACNEPLWSLANEFWYYALGAVLVMAVRRPALWLLAFAMIAGLLAADDAVDGRNVVLYAPIWAMGMLALSPASPRLRWWVALGLLAAALMLSRSHVLDPLYWLRDALIAGALVLVLNAVARARACEPHARLVAWGRGLAGFSYSLYLTHWPVLLAIRHLTLDGPLDPLAPMAYLVMLASAAFAFGFAWVFAWCTERHTRALRAALSRFLAMLRADLPWLGHPPRGQDP